MKKKNKFLQIFDIKMFLYDLLKLIAAPSVIIYNRLKRVYVDKSVKKTLRKQSYIVTCNHTSYMDVLVISNTFWTRRIRYVATKELFESKIRNFCFKLFRCIPIDKENVSMATFKEIKKTIENGHLIGVFPEGTIEREGEITQFKSGVVLMAIMAKAPIVPMYMEKRKKWYKRQRVVVGEVINVFDYIKGPIATMEEINGIAKMLFEKEQELKNKLN